MTSSIYDKSIFLLQVIDKKEKGFAFEFLNLNIYEVKKTLILLKRLKLVTKNEDKIVLTNNGRSILKYVKCLNRDNNSLKIMNKINCAHLM
jgi:hypothetical protein